MEKKVLNVITGGLGREGITTTQLEFMKMMDRSDLKIDIAAVHDNDEDVIREFESIGCNVLRFPDRKRKVLVYMKKLYSVLKYGKYDIIHVHGSSALMTIELLIARLAGVKVRIAHSRNTRSDHKKIDKILRPLFNVNYTHAFACGEYAGKWLFGDKPFYIIHNGKNLDKFRFSSYKREIVRNEYNVKNKVAIGFVGNFNHQKNLPFLIDVIVGVKKAQPESMFFLIGDGPEREKIENKITDLGLEESVLFMGRISNIDEILQAMDIMLLPSLFEGLPNVVLEWQACGLPCLISDCITQECKVTDLVTFLPIDKGIDEWVNAIISVNKSDNRKVISDSACQAMKKEGFDIKENVKFIKKLYLELSNKE